jgi:hypothetical protein
VQIRARGRAAVKIVLAVLCAFVGLVGVPAAAALAPGAVPGAAPEGVEAIRTYDVAMSLRKDASMHVTETIEYDFGSQQRHGIYRTIPVEFPYDDEYRRVYPLEDVEVSSPTGARTDLEVSGGATTTLRIGDPDEYVTGTQTYVIDYVVKGVVNSFTDHQELYWNVVGQEWDVPVDAVTASLEGPAPVDDALCFKGNQGSTEQCTVSGVGEGTVSFSASDLPPRQGVTIVVAFPVGTFPDATPILDEIWKPEKAFALTP